jgi:cyanophycin synthetase
MLEQSLLECGVSPEQLEVISSEVEAVNAGLAMAEAGDLLLIFGDEISRCWKQITGFKSGQEHSKSPKAATHAPVPDGIGAMEMQVQADFGDQVLIRDERGVRLAREVETSD